MGVLEDKLNMNAYGNTCPMCCGDLDSAAVCRVCRTKAAVSESPVAMSGTVPPLRDVEIQTGADLALPQVANI